MIPNNTPVGTPIVHIMRDGLRRAGHLTAPVYRNAAGLWKAPIRLADGRDLDVINEDIGWHPVELADPTDLDPPQLALFDLE